MGIPRFYKWINDRYNVIDIVKMSISLPYKIVDYLFIDSNAIIHNCAQKVFNYGEKKRLIQPYNNLSFEEKEMKIFELYYNKIIELTKIIKPRKVLYISIDGVAPLSKIMQQRQRRYMSSLKNSNNSNNSNTSNNSNNSNNSNVQFDPNCITPGTSFMRKLNHYVCKRILETGHKFCYKIIFSPSWVPGEGEHKIICELRKEKYSSQDICIYGPDGDLIMLALLPRCKQMFILRDNMFNCFDYDVINITILKHHLIRDMNNTKINDDYKINDFILIGFFVGNDFLPKIQMFYLLEDGMKIMLDIYSRLDESLVVNDGKINFSSFKKFVNELQLIESSLLEKQINYNKEDRFSNKTLNNCSEDGKLNYEKYISAYKLKIEQYSKYKNIVDDYYKGIIWVYQYYTIGCPTYRWFYPHYYAPLMVDFKKISDNKITFEYCPPYLPFQQLLNVLPPKSKDLLPPNLSHILISSPYSKYCPTIFEIDYEGKYQEHQGIALLPLVKLKTMEEMYNNNYVKDVHNKVGKIMIFKNFEGNKKYNTLFGEVSSNIKLYKRNLLT